MFRIIAFIRRYRFFFLFVLLEIFSFAMLISGNHYAEGWFFNFSSRWSGRIATLSDNVTGYFHLTTVNESLASQNARLMETQTITNVPTDSVALLADHHPQFRFIPAKIISNSTNRTNNYMLINKGLRDGIQKNMGVIAPNGIAGIVIGVSENCAVVMSLLHKSTNISAKILPTGIIGSVSWEGTNPNRLLLSNIPEHYKIKTGEQVVTSGYSLLFPEGIAIGSISRIELTDDAHLYRLHLTPTTDFQTLQWVYVVENTLRDEQETLLEQSEIKERL